MNQNIIMPTLIAFAISAALGPIMIPVLRRMKAGQTVREEGPQSHRKKTGTPTMGGIIILIAITVTTLLYIRVCPGILPILFLTLGFAMVGFVDDYIKVVLKRSMGLRPWQKMSMQFVITSIFAFYLIRCGISLEMKIPFFPDRSLDLGIWNVPFLFFVVLGTVNGTNFTDGLDGLATSVTILVATFFTVVAVGTGSVITPITCATVGALMGFLLFNVHPASVFMGDTGSLALGGFVVGCAYMLHMPLYIMIVGFVYLAEVLSVIIQVCYFRVTGGKRIFKMAPIHHHFELCGWRETKVVAVFAILTAILCLLGLLAV
ncbi:MAG: phospho-N-acetylmuramoyl-pentapeptide-transferase [Lachnospiraceae bacterium]|nr:phospho-N-acetylmuramoyl-pentapeptide-transferase [Lachnospiraceae bacterium]